MTDWQLMVLAWSILLITGQRNNAAEFQAYVGQSANGEYFACRDPHAGKVTIVDRRANEMASFPDSAMTACYVADDGTALLKINLYRYSPVYLTIETARTNYVLPTDTLLRLIGLPSGPILPPAKPNALPLVIMGTVNSGNAAALYFQERNTVLNISSAWEITTEKFEGRDLASQFCLTAIHLLTNSISSRRLELDFTKDRTSPPPFWPIPDTLKFVQRHKRAILKSLSRWKTSKTQESCRQR